MIPLARSFSFESVSWDEARSTITAQYKTVLERGDTIPFEEKILLPSFLSLPEDEMKRAAFNRLLTDIHLILGISYWKLHCAPEINLVSGKLTKEQTRFWNTIYTIGLGEFYYRNKLLPFPHVSFPVAENVETNPVQLTLSDQALVGIGGGKDSLVSVELLKEMNYPIKGFAVEHSSQGVSLDQLSGIIDKELCVLKRSIDPKLNTLTDVYKGHVPISAVYGFLGVLCCLLTDSRYVIVSNEKSADEPNVLHDGTAINHQWSKSEEFEELLRSYIHSFVSPDITYFSLLRPLHEIGIVKQFIQYPQYFHAFSSCNRNFRSTQEKQRTQTGLNWCGDCPKCAFAFVMLAAFLPRNTVYDIFQANLFEKTSLIPLYRELLGLEGVKPWDCVGTFEETQLAFALAHERNEWEHTPVMQMFVEDVLPDIRNVERMKRELLRVDEDSLRKLPERFRECFE